ncbi:MAG: hypothetical protein E5V62_02995 [Mesorhizobium sp.]|uniref:hypothetical protein n=1 Tax=Mesorhizobium sp. TaxID=1871066 RepID=UPI00120A06BD|nr:hypothetical protein [Mesorhizobium sp.]TIW37132.1 MAG: hypothetical protein E5V62_02995 [Mesorhizobium sp.]
MDEAGSRNRKRLANAANRILNNALVQAVASGRKFTIEQEEHHARTYTKGDRNGLRQHLEDPAEAGRDRRGRAEMAVGGSRTRGGAGCHRLWHNQVPGMPPKITAAEVDKAGAEIAPFLDKEKEAQQSLEAERAAFDAEVESLRPKIESYRAAISARLDELEDFIALGGQFYAASVEARVRLPSKVPGRCQSLLGPHGLAMLRKLLNAVD